LRIISFVPAILLPKSLARRHQLAVVARSFRNLGLLRQTDLSRCFIDG
jgi:hypothetical protein